MLERYPQECQGEEGREGGTWYCGGGDEGGGEETPQCGGPQSQLVGYCGGGVGQDLSGSLSIQPSLQCQNQ